MHCQGGGGHELGLQVGGRGMGEVGEDIAGWTCSHPAHSNTGNGGAHWRQLVGVVVVLGQITVVVVIAGVGNIGVAVGICITNTGGWRLQVSPTSAAQVALLIFRFAFRLRCSQIQLVVGMLAGNMFTQGLKVCESLVALGALDQKIIGCGTWLHVLAILGSGLAVVRRLVVAVVVQTGGQRGKLHGEGCGWHALLNDGILLAET